MDPFLSIHYIHSLVRQEKKHQESNIQNAPLVDYVAPRVTKQIARPSTERQRPFCDDCHKHDHTIFTCYLIHGFPCKHAKQVGPPSKSPTITKLTPQQYAKLLTLLLKEET